MPGTQGYVQVPPDNAAGTKMDTFARTIGSDTIETQVGLAGKLTKIVNATLTRPANTTAYASGDAVTDTGGAALSFLSVARDTSAGSGRIVGAVCTSSADEATKPQLELWLFGGAAAPTATVDNSATVHPDDTEILQLLGIITFTTWYEGIAGTSGSSAAPATLINGIAGGRIPFVCGAAVDDIFGLVIIRSAYTPISGEVFTFRLAVEQD